MKVKTFLKSARIENFKAIQDSHTVSFTPLTVFIGNNGSGKSSLIEGLETYRTIIADGLDAAMSRWFGFEHVWNKQSRHNLPAAGFFENPMKFTWAGQTEKVTAKAHMIVNTKPGFNALFIQEEQARLKDCREINRVGDLINGKEKIEPGRSGLPGEARDFVLGWQFLSLMPANMGTPAPKKMATAGTLLLNRDGSNLAQYLSDIRDKDTSAFNGIIDAMRFVLDYAGDFQPVETQEIQRTMYVSMKEKRFSIPGWMLSTGTVRVLALLAVLRNPNPPRVLIIEEIENGLDPRTIHLVLEEIRIAVQSGQTQVIMTTHSPYVLNLLPLPTIVLVERDTGGDPVFWRPAGEHDVQEWAKRFTPGELYTTGRFRRPRQ
ncbi:MAG: hypothetical protein A2511_13555 [Deltaproteobacteria bacterium RIFOXYD12_FULL_50_9]|nr:MAG: hypothetical protein A2511_13555 [Deltaproteobacteria bacterium RIFOXYD12_FULL_50_9]